MSGRKDKEKKIIEELNKCLILPDEEKVFWIENVGSLPDILLDSVLSSVSSKNEKINMYLDAAIKAGASKSFITELKNRIKKIKRTAFELDEKAEKSDVDEMLEDQLDNLQ